MIIYLSGAMMGEPNHGFDKFNEAAEFLRENGHFVLNPADKCMNGDPEELSRKPATRAMFMRRDIHHILMSDCIMMLEPWQKSTGARLEFQVAESIGLPVYEYNEQLKTAWSK